MKKYGASLIIISTFLSVQLFSQRIVEGYYINLTNDSIRATFRIPERLPSYITDQPDNRIDFTTLKDEVVVIGPRGSTKRLTPKDIKGFVFTYHAEVYHLFSKPVTEYRSNFLRPQIVGEKLRLYHYSKGHPGYPMGFGHKSSSPGWKEYFWTFEKNDRTYLFLNSKMKRREIVGSLKEFFKDDPQIQELIDQKFRRLMADKAKAIVSIVEAYNEGNTE